MFLQKELFVSLILTISLLPVQNLYSKEYKFDAGVSARAEYNENIFLTPLPHDSVTGVIVTPYISGIIKEKNWDGALKAKVKSHHYSDNALDSNDQYFDITGRYNDERNILSLNINYDLASNLNSDSSDFGVVGRRVNTKIQSLTPQYTRLLTERSALIISYTYSDVDYLEAEGTAFTPYVTEAVTGSFIYDLTDRDKLTFTLYGVDYKSKNDLVKYQLFSSRIGIDHELTETISADFLIGVSRRNSTNLQTRSINFAGETIVLIPEEINFSDRGFVLDAGLKKMFESSELLARVSRDNTTDSFGGLNQVDKYKLDFNGQLTELWRYDLSSRFEDITAISSRSRASDRTLLFLQAQLFYSVSSRWTASMSYRYTQRKFKNDTSGDKAPHSNMIYVGFTYNLPSLSTF